MTGVAPVITDRVCMSVLPFAFGALGDTTVRALVKELENLILREPHIKVAKEVSLLRAGLLHRGGASRLGDRGIEFVRHSVKGDLEYSIIIYYKL